MAGGESKGNQEASNQEEDQDVQEKSEISMTDTQDMPPSHGSPSSAGISDSTWQSQEEHLEIESDEACTQREGFTRAVGTDQSAEAATHNHQGDGATEKDHEVGRSGGVSKGR